MFVTVIWMKLHFSRWSHYFETILPAKCLSENSETPSVRIHTGQCLVPGKLLQEKKKKKVNSYETAKWILTLCRVTCRVRVACLIADKLWKATKYSFSCPNSRWPQIIPNSRYHNEPLLPKSTLLKIFHWTTFPLCICQFKDLNTLGPDFAAVAFTFLKWPTC